MTYAQVKAKIQAALTLRQSGTKVAVVKHEEAEIAILDYIEAAKANFSEKYNSPFAGSANTILSKAIKHMAVRELEDEAYFYIGYVKCGLFAVDTYLYEILIMQVIDFSDPQQDIPAFLFTAQVRDPYTGPMSCILDEADGSGRYGNMSIDWSQLTLGETYTCQSYMEGCLFGYSLISDMGTTGGGTSFLKRESFPAVAGQTVFTPTKFHLTADALVIINNSIQSPDIYTIAGNTLTFNAECNADDIVTILN
jgi:hypothetical protein